MASLEIGLGNFMVRVDLKAADDKTVAFSSRPVSIITNGDGFNWASGCLCSCYLQALAKDIR